MKKTVFKTLLALVLVALPGVLCGCKGCTSEKQEAKGIDDPVPAVYHDYDGEPQDFTAGTATVQALHRQTMAQMLGGGDYEWRNSRIVLSGPVTADGIDTLRVTDVIDVFTYWNERGPWVQFISSSVTEGTQVAFPVNDVWIEDANMSEAPVRLSAEQALQRLKEYNGLLPNGYQFLTLRLPVGPKDCNPQWVVGGAYDPLFIDAVTGEIRDWNPAFLPTTGAAGLRQ